VHDLRWRVRYLPPRVLGSPGPRLDINHAAGPRLIAARKRRFSNQYGGDDDGPKCGRSRANTLTRGDDFVSVSQHVGSIPEAPAKPATTTVTL